jgi:hypothetical protein
MYYKARMYHPGLGRFLQTDPVGYKDGLNWYDYVGGDPVNKNDPSGLCTGSLVANKDGTCKSSGTFTAGSGTCEGNCSVKSSGSSSQTQTVVNKIDGVVQKPAGAAETLSGTYSTGTDLLQTADTLTNTGSSVAGFLGKTGGLAQIGAATLEIVRARQSGELSNFETGLYTVGSGLTTAATFFGPGRLAGALGRSAGETAVAGTASGLVSGGITLSQRAGSALVIYKREWEGGLMTLYRGMEQRVREGQNLTGPSVNFGRRPQ